MEHGSSQYCCSIVFVFDLIMIEIPSYMGCWKNRLRFIHDIPLAISPGKVRQVKLPDISFICQGSCLRSCEMPKLTSQFFLFCDITITKPSAFLT